MDGWMVFIYFTFREPVQLVERVQMRAKGQHPVCKELCPWQGCEQRLWFRGH